MATNVLAGYGLANRVALLHTADLTATLTTLARSTTQQICLAAQTRGKIIPHFFFETDAGADTPNWAIKAQHSDGPPRSSPSLAEASWDWEDLVSFTAVTATTGSSEYVEPTKPIRKYLRFMFTRTGGSLTGIRAGYKYAQVGPRANVGTLSGTIE